MPAYEVSRTLVKSQPEVWAELEQAERLAELLGDDAIKITKSEPESTIEWQGSTANGSIEIAASGWGTKVSLKANVKDSPVASAPAEPAPPQEPLDQAESSITVAPVMRSTAATVMQETALESDLEVEEAAAPEQVGFWSKIKAMFGSKEPVGAEPPAEPESEPDPEPEPVAIVEPEAQPEPEAIAQPAPAPEPEPVREPVDYEALLTGVLDHLGSAHKRPFVNG
jgi:hypothetical protein